MRFFHHPLVVRLRAVGLPFFTAGPRARALGGLGLLVGLLLAVNGLNVVNSYAGRDTMTALAERELWRFYFCALWLGCVFAASSVAEVLAHYVEQRLGLLWRDWLTRRLLDRYLAGRAYHRLAEHAEVDNPDQRISEDVKTFTATTLSFLILLFNAAVTFLAFASVLWSIAPWLFVVAVGYAAVGSLGTLLLGHRLVGLDNQQLRKEADFRYALGRLREHGPAVAQMEGEAAEKGRLGERLAALVANFRDVVAVNRNLGFFTSLYNYLPQIIPALVVAPMYVRGEVEFGTVTQSAMAFGQLLGAFSLFVSQFQQLSAYAAVVGRIGSLWEATEPGAAPAAEAPAVPAVEVAPDRRGLKYEGLTLRGPMGRELVRDLTLEVPEGKRLLVTGPCGAGKTALLLASAGLWPAGTGRVLRPGGARFVPQRPYLPAGRLRDLLLYGLGRAVSEERLREVLSEVGLEHLGDLEVERNWAAVLSGGEQRALAVARLLLGGPCLAFLDGLAWGLDVLRAERLYRALARAGITYVSTGGPADLLAYHDLRLELRGDGGWRVEPARSGEKVGQAFQPAM